MNSKLIGLVVGVVLIAGGVFFALSGDDSDSANSNTNQTAETVPGSESAATNQLGINTVALEGAYQLDISGTEDGEELSGTILLDGNGNFSTEVTTEGQTVGFVLLDGVTYVQNPADQSWVSYPADSAAAPSLDVEDLSISDEDLEEINSDTTIEDLGEQECSLGTCRVYQDVDSEDNETAIVKVEVGTGRLAEIVITDNESGDENRITYSYPENVNIVAPEGATEFDLSEFITQ